MSIKVSVVMQSYLGGYNNARKDPEDKLRRAINSFINQNCRDYEYELVIVSDGCQKTLEIYNNEYRHIPNIKFVYLDKKSGHRMYGVDGDGNRWWRGFPRNIGIGAAEGEIIAYLDSDDMLSQDFISILIQRHNENPDKDWLWNHTWIGMVQDCWTDTNFDWAYDIDGLPGKWTGVWIPDDKGMMTTWLISHKATTIVKWADTVNVSDDSTFVAKLIEKYPNYAKHIDPIYIYCHHFEGLYDV